MTFLLISQILNFILGLGAIILTITLAVPSDVPDIYIFSYSRFIALCGIFLFSIYFFIAMLLPKFAKFNVKCSLVILISILVHEAVIRSVPSIITEEMLTLLPPSARAQVLASRNDNDSGATGTGMLHHWTPGAPSKTSPWVISDSNGYRNPEVPKTSTDVVLLGSSTLLSAATKFTFAEGLRERGHEAYSLAMGSYSPQHFLAAYKRFILQPGISHSTVIAVITIAYDVQKSNAFIAVRDNGGNWADYLYSPNAKHSLPGAEYLPWTISMLYYLSSRLVTNMKAELRQTQEDDKSIGIYKYAGDVYPLSKSVLDENYTSFLYENFNEALVELGALTRQFGVKLNVVALPPSPIRMLLASEVDDVFKLRINAILNDYRTAINNVRELVESQDAKFIDLSEAIAQNAANDQIFIHTYDHHFNEKGVVKIFNALYPDIEFGVNVRH